MATLKIRMKLEPQGPATALVLSDKQVTELGGGKRAAVKVTINKKTVQLRLGVMGGKNLIGLSKAAREEFGVAIGDTVSATIDLDTAERTVEVPDDFAAALKKAKLRDTFDALAFTHRKEHVRAIEEAKKPETRTKRIDAAIEKLRA
ncbi:MAG: YdeI/OmpD-associated family protein [Kofleriaceae bacterium]